jgi:acetolactate synthase-1/2/3 large subunit
VRRADLVIFIGCRAGSVTTERWRYPAPGVGVIHIDNDPMTIGANYPVEVALAADAKLALEALNAELCRRKARVDFNGAAIAKRARAAKFAAFSRVAANKKTPLRPEAVISALNQILPPEAIVAADAGTPCPYFSAYYQLPLAGRRFLSNRAHGALGYALACALGAHFAAPRAKVVAAMGDGSFAFSAGELETVARLAPPLLMVVFSNSSYGWIKAGQKAKFGARYFGVDFSPTDHAAVASAFGIYARRVVAPEELSPALKAAAARAGPALVDVVCQPLEESRAPVAEWIA